MATRLLEMTASEKNKFIARKNAKYSSHKIVIVKNGCHLVKIKRKKGQCKNRYRYPLPLKLSFKDKEGRTVKTQVRLHVLYYFLEYGGGWIESDREISHKCNDSKCVNVTHLTVEPHKVNCSRRKCFSPSTSLFSSCYPPETTCVGHGSYEDCVIPPESEMCSCFPPVP